MKGCVCYIDILGIAYLSTTIKQQHIEELVKKLHNSIFLSIKSKDIDFSLLSDSVFLYSQNTDSLLIAISNIFRKCICAGVLIRAGLTYGEYSLIKSKLSHKQIYGEAVSKAVQLESNGKGCRIFINSNFPHDSENSLWNHNPIIFKPYKSYIDYSIIDVFEWPLCPIPSNAEELKKLIFNNYRVIVSLLYSPDFSWNTETEAGKIQLCATIDYISNIIKDMIKESKYNDICSDEIFMLSDDSEIPLILKHRKKEIVKKQIINFANKIGINTIRGDFLEST